MIDGSGGLIGFDVSSGGAAALDNTRAARLFKIVSGTNPYTASEVYLDESDGSRVPTGVYDVTAAMKLLHEVNGVDSVKADVVVEATPNQFGTGFTFTAPAGSGCGLPFAFKVQVGTSVTRATVSGTSVVTGVIQRFRDITISEDGCWELGEPYCVTATDDTCVDGEIPDSPQWWCLDGTCVEAYDGLEPAGSTGPYATKTACVTACATYSPEPCGTGYRLSPGGANFTRTGENTWTNGTLTMTRSGTDWQILDSANPTCYWDNNGWDGTIPSGFVTFGEGSGNCFTDIQVECIP